MTTVRPVVSTSTACWKASALENMKRRCEHLDHVVVGMLIVIQQHDAVEGNEPLLFLNVGFGARGGLSHRTIQSTGIRAAWVAGLGIWATILVEGA